MPYSKNSITSNKLLVKLRVFKKKTITPIHVHKNKTITEISPELTNKFYENIMNELNLFSKKWYGLKPLEGSQRKDIYYEGRFILSFDIGITKKDGKTSCNINLIASELEIKHNISYVRSIISEKTKVVQLDTHINNTEEIEI